jgi:hypothetical protein
MFDRVNHHAGGRKAGGLRGRSRGSSGGRNFFVA